MQALFDKQKAYFDRGTTIPRSSRADALDRLERAILDYQDEIEDALKEDLNKSSFEAYTTEVGFVRHSLRKARRHLKKWMKTRRRRTPFFHLFTRSYIKPEPLGTVLIIGPYNYPFQLVMEPLIGAIAAGNTAIVKPSEFPSATETVIKKMLNETFDDGFVHVVTGGKETTQSLIALPFDHIFFTGSPRVGRIVYQAASENLTPVTLELGGKTPTIVDEHAKLKVAARRIAFGKGLNAGQTCIAPDFLYVHENVKDEFLRILKETLDEFFNDTDDFPRIINDRHYERITSLIDEDKVVYGNHRNAESRYLSMTVMDNVSFEDPVMKEEIFGPVLPVLTFFSLDEVVSTLKERPKPLALYVFTERRQNAQRLFDQLPFGGGAINDTITHVANPHLPFGGVGESGIGVYHGKYTFDAFTHYKSFVKKSTKADPPVAYPPYSQKKEKLVRRLMK